MYTKKIQIQYKKYPVFTKKDVSQLLKNKSNAEINMILKYMANKGYIYRIEKGIYSLYNDIDIIGFAYRPFYYGLQYALTVHNLWGQATNPVVITTKKCRYGLRKVFNTNVVLHRVLPKYLFGYELIKQGNFDVPVSDLEKTFIDFVFFGIKLNSDVKQKIIKKIDRKKLLSYIQHYPKYLQTQIKSELGKMKL